MAALDSTTTKFADLSKVSEENMEELGVKAGDCMELGDSSGSFIRDLQEEIDGLNALVPHVFELKKSHDTTLQDKRDREHTLQWQLSEAESSVSVSIFILLGCI